MNIWTYFAFGYHREIFWSMNAIKLLKELQRIFFLKQAWKVIYKKKYASNVKSKYLVCVVFVSEVTLI